MAQPLTSAILTVSPAVREQSSVLFFGNVDTLFYLLAITQILLGAYLVWHGAQWLAYVRRRLHSDPGFYAPRAAVLCPCKGIEPGLERNLVALTEFERQNYEIFFILASEKDAARSVIERVAKSSRVKTNVVIAGHPVNCGEKVNNLRAAIEQLPEEFEVLVFADSDGRPGKHWLHHLVAPLADSRVGATSTMRWLVPNSGSGNLPTVLLAAWNAPIVTMLGGRAKNFCWGGGTAIRRATFEQSGVLEEWKNSVSDDYSMTRALERTGRSILFLPECLTLSYIETDFGGVHSYRRVGAKTGFPFHDADFPAVAAVRYPRSSPSYRSDGGVAGRARTNHGPGVDLRRVDPVCALPLRGELCELFGYTQNPMARHGLRINQPAANADSVIF